MIKFPSPERAKEYPFYIFGYWITISLLLLSLSVIFQILPNLTRSGMNVESRTCLEEDTYSNNAPYDNQEHTYCSKYGAKEYTPVGKAIVTNAATSFILTGLVVWGFGIFAWKEARAKEYIDNIINSDKNKREQK